MEVKPDHDLRVDLLPVVFAHDHGLASLPFASVDDSRSCAKECLVELELMRRSETSAFQKHSSACTGRGGGGANCFLKHLSNPRWSTRVRRACRVLKFTSP